jgi:hypothetical protein
VIEVLNYETILTSVCRELDLSPGMEHSRYRALLLAYPRVSLLFKFFFNDELWLQIEIICLARRVGGPYVDTIFDVTVQQVVRGTISRGLRIFLALDRIVLSVLLRNKSMFAESFFELRSADRFL